jgi:D-alanyl-D-alanine carboxypeptidase/D-alanyl-D-alanine-endopeptidase (penicillin-binding protein 4)
VTPFRRSFLVIVSLSTLVSFSAEAKSRGRAPHSRVHVASAHAATKDSKAGGEESGAVDYTARFRADIERAKVPLDNLGIFVTEQDFRSVDGQTGRPADLAAINADKKMIPASITKICTAAATLDHFPPGFKFKTQLISSAPIKDGVLKGDLILKGGGDPSFVSENMWFLVNAFVRNRIQKIEGDIVVDDSLFDRLRIDSSRESERVDRAFDAPIGAMSFNWNSVNVFVRPGAKSGEPAAVFADPESDYIQVKGEVKTVGESGKTHVEVSRLDDKKNFGDVIRVTGQIALGATETVVYKNITDPDLWSGANLKAFLAHRGISVTGKIRNGIPTGETKVLAEAEGPGIERILADMNKFSNNYVAEMLTKNMAALKAPPGTIKGGMEVIGEYLRKIGVPASAFELQNPSGFTRGNFITARALGQVLLEMKNNFQFHSEFMASLPLAGVDGTLKKRMKGTPAERWVRAKTGYLNGVVALAGYAGRRDGRVLTFVFMFNGKTPEDKIRSLFDRLAEDLVSI